MRRDSKLIPVLAGGPFLACARSEKRARSHPLHKLRGPGALIFLLPPRTRGLGSLVRNEPAPAGRRKRGGARALCCRISNIDRVGMSGERMGRRRRRLLCRVKARRTGSSAALGSVCSLRGDGAMLALWTGHLIIQDFSSQFFVFCFFGLEGSKMEVAWGLNKKKCLLWVFSPIQFCQCVGPFLLDFVHISFCHVCASEAAKWRPSLLSSSFALSGDSQRAAIFELGPVGRLKRGKSSSCGSQNWLHITPFFFLPAPPPPPPPEEGSSRVQDVPVVRRGPRPAPARPEDPDRDSPPGKTNSDGAAGAGIGPLSDEGLPERQVWHRRRQS